MYTGIIYRGPSLITECARALAAQAHIAAQQPG
jgi:hypothetical protein